MSTLDLTIIVAYVLFITWKGLAVAHTHNSTDDFFLANRSLSWPFIGLSLFATNISSSTIIGLSSSGYKTGISVFDYEWTGAIMLVIFAIFIVPLYLRYSLTTMPEYLERRFDHRSRIYFSLIAITVNIFIDVAGALYASGLFLNALFPNINLDFFVLIMAFIAGIYTIFGGLRAVVVTDSIQAVLLTLGTGVVAFITYQHAGSWSDIKTALDPGLLSLIRPADDRLLPWPTLFVSLPILGFYFMCTNQHMVQRVLGAKSIEDGRKGAVFAALLKLPILFLLVLPGAVAHMFYPHLENSNRLFPLLMFHYLPTGLLGIVLTGFIAALMSSIDSALTAASSMATMDIYHRYQPESSQRHLILFGKFFIMAAVLVASLWAPFIEQFPTLWEYLQAFLSYLSPPLVTCFLFGLFWSKASSKAAFASLWMGNILGIVFIINNYFFALLPPVHYLYSATIIFLFSSIIMVTISLLFPDESEIEVINDDIKPSLIFASELPWYKSYKMLALLVCLCTTGIVIAFW